MGTKVIINSTSPNRVLINNQQPKNIRTVAIAATSTSRFASLSDVDVGHPDNNETVVYDAVSEKYVVKILPVVDGGTF